MSFLLLTKSVSFGLILGVTIVWLLAKNKTENFKKRNKGILAFAILLGLFSMTIKVFI